ncbi:uncharacterized protein EAF02_011971 [Botrytis sinoallii]|uniref:uncharacterized protein n=1 Tax=Botrytis sinoallii TaxID=1463999 RepID=UPI0019028BBB|nr:uncharacterized protein EAF02_011971 [Botrytis sinoallii]KAF7853317.1 hypothetical protein EAF02_011971 [Botrytis sinoallii]
MSRNAHMTVSLIFHSLPTSVQQAIFWKSKKTAFWSSRKDKILPPSGPTGKKNKGSNKSVQQAAKPKEDTRHATAATSGGEQTGDRSTGGTDASRHSFYIADKKRESYHDSCDTSEHTNDEVQNFHEVRAHERGS